MAQTAKRQGLYSGGVGHGAEFNLPMLPRVSAAPETDDGSGRVASGIGDLGQGIIGALAREYRAGQEALIQDRVLDVSRKFAEWKADYMQNRQGGDAASAAADFAAEYERLASGAIGEFGGKSNEVFEGDLRRKLAANGLMAARDGFQWQTVQTRQWKDSVWQGLVARHEDMVNSDLYDSEARDFSLRQLEETYRNLYPGLDPGAAVSALRERTDRAVLQGLLEAGKAGDERALAEAERLLGGGDGGTKDSGGGSPGAGGGVSTGSTGASQAGGRPGVKFRSRHGLSGEISGGKLSLPEDVDGIIQEACAEYNVPLDIARGVAMQESSGRQDLKSRAGACGVFQLMPGTARELGVNRHDKRQNIFGGVRYLKKMLDQHGGDVELALTAYNFGAGNVSKWRGGRRSIPAEAYEYAGRVMGYARQSGGGGGNGGASAGATSGSLAGISSGRRQAALAQIASIREKKRLDAARSEQAGLLNEKLSEWADAPYARQLSSLYEYVAGISDRQAAAAVFRAGKAEIEFQRGRLEAREQAEAEEFLAAQEGQSPMQSQLALQNSTLSDGARRIVQKELGREDKLDPRLAQDILELGKLAIEEGQLRTDAERRRYALEHNLPVAQRKELLAYRANEDHISPLQIQSLAEKFEIPAEYQGHALAEIRRMFRGRAAPPNEREIELAVARLAAQGATSGWLGWLGLKSSMTALEAIDNLRNDRADGQNPLDYWQAEVESYEEAELDSLLTRQGIKTTPKNRSILKTLNTLPADVFANAKIPWEN